MIDVSAVAEVAVAAFESLTGKFDPDTGRMPAARVPGAANALFARASDGTFYLMLGMSATKPATHKRSEVLVASLGVPYELEEATTGSQIEATFATIALKPGNDELVTAFGLLAGLMLAGLPDAADAADIEVFLDNFVALFAPRHTLAREVALGLWGELWLMLQFDEPAGPIRAWHEESSGRFDFSFPNSRIEVKTTESVDRVHAFSLVQLSESSKPTWIASIRVVADSAGKSIVDLISSISAVVPVVERARLARIAAKVLDGDFEAAADFRYEPSDANPLALVSASDVPRVVVPDGSVISDVHFRVNINAQAAMSSTTLAEAVPTEGRA